MIRMKLPFLKKIRVAVSLFFFFSVSILFLDYLNIIPPRLHSYIVYLQFVPSLIKFAAVSGTAAAGFGIIILLTLLFGRIYCSSICPLGTLQDFISALAKKFNRKKYYRKNGGNKILQYFFLSLSVITFLAGSVFAINLLDPFSNFGRIFTSLLKPLLILVNNLFSSLLANFNIYSVYAVEIKSFDIVTFIYAVSFLSILTWLSFKNGRLFCNSVCPVGTLLGLISRFSFLKIEINEKNCISCSLCERVCKGGCIDKKNKIVDFSNCVSCYNCLTVCPSNGISFKGKTATLKKKRSAGVDWEKRKFVSQVIIYLAGITGIAKAQNKIIPKKLSTIPVKKINTVSPPGSLSIKRFTDSCTACHLCVSACPPQVLQPSFLEYGILGIMQPHMNYNISYCTFECNICGDVCPSGAILPIKIEEKKLAQLGKAKFIKDNCIVYTENKDCGACAEHCPTKAVKMIPYKNLRAPKITEDYCVGCGACEHACPTKPYKSIYVEGNPVHLVAKKNVEEKLKEPDESEDFPF